MNRQLSSDLNEDTPDDILLDYIAMQEEFLPEAKTAFTIFYNRYSAALLEICRRICKAFKKNKSDADDLVHETFIKVWVTKPIVKKEKFLIPNFTLRWLKKITVNIFYDVHRMTRVQVVYQADTNELELMEKRKSIYQSQEFVNYDIQKSNEAFIKEYLEGLLNSNPRDFYVVTQYYQFVVEGEHIPEKILEEIARRNKTTKDNVHQIISRTRKKIKSILQSKIIIRA